MISTCINLLKVGKFIQTVHAFDIIMTYFIKYLRIFSIFKYANVLLDYLNIGISDATLF